MNTEELNFAYKVRHALSENLDSLPAGTLDKLAAARKTAVSRKKRDTALRVYVPRRLLAGSVGSFFSEPLSLLARMGLVLPLVVVALGLAGLYEFEQQRRLDDTAEIDAAVLSDELPLSAYLDNGFNGYLAKRGE